MFNLMTDFHVMVILAIRALKKKNSNNAESFDEHFYQCIKLSVLKVGNNVKGIIQ